LFVSCGNKEFNSSKSWSLVIAEEILWIELFSSIGFIREELISFSRCIWFDISSCFNSDLFSLFDDRLISDRKRFCLLSSRGVLVNANDDDRDSLGLEWKEISNSSIDDGPVEWFDSRRSLLRSTSLVAFSSVVYNTDSSYWKLSSVSPNDLLNWFPLSNSSIEWNILV